MVSIRAISTESLERLLADQGRLELSDIVRSLEPLDDNSLAQLIELDGRSRMRVGAAVDLRRYLDAVPELRSRVVALDAAIDMALRSLSGGSSPTPEAVTTLENSYPDLASVIREAAVLADSICSTSILAAKLRPQRALELPADFGASLPDGRRRYLLTQVLGRGSQGLVYLATDRLLSEPDQPALVAIKVLAGTLEGPLARERFAEEATKARRIDHPNVVRVLDRGTTDDGNDYIVYEYVSGGDLSAFIAKQGLPLRLKLAVSLVSQVARGVQSAHAAGLVHCDLKPGNIMMDGTVAKVADFGVAVRLGSGAAPEELFKQGLGVGNIAFISPEQFQFQERGATIPSDIYALGGILFYLGTGILPNGSSLDEICRRHDPSSRLAPSSMRAVNRAGDRDLDRICQRALARRPHDRHQSAGELADDLDRWLKNEPIPWTRPTSVRQLRLAARRRPLTTLIVAILIVGIAAACGVGFKLNLDAQEERIARVKTQTRNGIAQEVAASIFHLLERHRDASAQRPRLSSSVLTQGLLMQWALTPDLFDAVSNAPDFWTDRIQLGDAVLQSSGSILPGSLEELMWQSSLAYWLISSGAEDEALAILPHNREAWGAMLKPSDPWLEQLRALEACAIVRRELKTAGAGAPADMAKLRDAEAVLRSERSLFGPNADGGARPKYRGPNEGTALHLLVLQTMIDLYSSSVRPDPGLREQVQARLNEYVSHRKPAPKSTERPASPPGHP